MTPILLYRHPDCARCARIARTHRLFDWRGRFADTTAVPPTGPLRLGEIVVEERATGRVLRGADALDRLCREIPAYAVLRPFLRMPAVRARVDREMAGCDSVACAAPEEVQRRGSS